jgi:hypothetical protein
MGACTYLGPEFDARKWDYFNKPTPYCGCQTLEGKSYCADHYYVVYKKGSSNLKNNTRAIERDSRHRAQKVDRATRSRRRRTC